MVGCFTAIDASTQERIKKDPSLVADILNADDEGGESPRTIDVDKAWHGIHFLLTGQAWGGDGPLAQAVMGGTEIGEEVGYGPARLLESDYVKDVASALANIGPEELRKRFVPKAMATAEVYPEVIWERDGEEALDYLVEYYVQLVAFYKEAAERGDGVLIWLS